MKKIFKIIYIALFLGILCTPAALQLFNIRESRKSSENRKMKLRPKFDIAHLDPFPSKFDAYYMDHFPYRNSMSFIFSYVNLKYLNKSPLKNEVVLGKENWLYPVDNSYKLYTGKLRFTNEEISAATKELNDRYEECKKAGAEYRLVIIPSKYSLYPEYLPSYIHPAKDGNPSDEYLSALEKNSSVKILRLLDTLKNAKKEGQLFIKGDTHWNQKGAYFGYRGIINWLKKDYPALKPFRREDLEFKDTVNHRGNLTGQLGLNEIWPETFCNAHSKIPSDVRFRPKENYPCDTSWFSYCFCYEEARMNTKDTTLPGLLVFRDSFTDDFMMWLLASNYGRSTYIWNYWHHSLTLKVLKKERPKIVICIMNETFIDNLFKYPYKLEEENKQSLNKKR